MALTAFPTILFNAATGSDSAASGAGPATAITGTCAASTNSTTVTFNGNPDLSGIAQDGSHVLWVTGIGFVRISTVDNSAKTCVVETALTIANNTDFAIGGKRATLDETESRRLFAATSSPTASGAGSLWVISLEDDHSLTSTLTVTAVATTGPITIESSSSSSRRTITQTGNAATFTITPVTRLNFNHIVFRNSNATKQSVFSFGNTGVVKLNNCICGDNGGTNCPLGLAIRTSGNPIIHAYNSAVIRCTGVGINLPSGGVKLDGCDVSRNGGHGIAAGGGASGVVIRNSIIAYNSGDGINCSTAGTAFVSISNNTIDGNTGDGIEFTSANVTNATDIVNNQITNNGAFGLNCSSTTPHGLRVQHNNFYGNSTAPANGITLDATNLTLDPSYTDRTDTVRNYGVGTAMKAAGFPASTATIGAGQSGTTTYVDIGAAQRQEAASGGQSRGRYQ